MKIKKISEKDNVLKISLKDTDVATANAIRRTIMNEVPTMAIDDIEILKNSSALFDEVLAHRLGLIPFKTDLKSYTSIDECTCEGATCAKCSVDFTLEGSKADYIYSEEIKSKDPKIKSTEKNFPIVKLLSGQKIEVEGKITMNRGKVHSKWSPGLVFYEEKDGEFIMTVESFGQIPPGKMIQKAIEILQKKNAAFAELIKNKI